MAHILAVKEAPIGGLQRTLHYLMAHYDDAEFGQLLDGCWRPYRRGPDLYEFAGQRFLYDEYQVVGREGAYALHIWLHNRPGDRLALQIRNGSRPGFAEIMLVDVDRHGCGLPEMLDLMWQEAAPGGLQETLVRLAALA